MHVQRAIESAGLPTLLITVDPAQSAQARPPRAVYPAFNAIGHPVGHAGEVAAQRRLLERVFAELLTPFVPGHIRELQAID